ncbi:hypothetical protein B0H19DRAFT_185964 [Mycena capillaripes]|nr:hypothetical protein B0H19DRAFT_185964 [Mycena capillaripes]
MHRTFISQSSGTASMESKRFSDVSSPPDSSRDQPDDTSILQRRIQAEMFAIDTEIAWHYDQIALLKAKRNAIVPICNLPNELITRILTTYAVESNTLFNLKWTKLMLICRHWHALSLAAQPLWAFIDLTWDGNLRRLFVQLRRSGAAPLTVKVDFSAASHYQDIVLDHLERIAQLKVSGESKAVYELIGRLPDCKLPILTTFSLDPSFRRNELPHGFVEALPNDLIGDKLPNLRQLTLVSVAFPWTSLSGLSALSLTRCNDSSQSSDSATTHHGTFSTLLEMLGSCPQLHSLILDHTLPQPAPDQLYPTVDLPALTILSLRAPRTSACKALLNHLRISSATSIRLLFDNVHSGAKIRDILVPIRKHIRAPHAQQPLQLQIDRTAVVSYCATTVFHDTIIHDLLTRHSAPCAFALACYPGTERALRQVLTKVLNAIPTASITQVDARGAYDFGEVSWRAVIKLLPALEALYFQVNSGAVNCVRALSQLEELDLHHQTSPRIRHLHVRIARSRAGDDTLTTLLIALEEYFQLCHANGNSLEGLDMEDNEQLLAGQEEILDRLFTLMEGPILRNGIVYDPAEHKKRQEELETERGALAAEFGIEF